MPTRGAIRSAESGRHSTATPTPAPAIRLPTCGRRPASSTPMRAMATPSAVPISERPVDVYARSMVPNETVSATAAARISLAPADRAQAQIARATAAKRNAFPSIANVSGLCPVRTATA